ncbi:MAG: TldD/PmbA family protein [Christensenella sp.]|nr:MAG: TldD/PmbA family protein [Christensenella sp.]
MFEKLDIVKPALKNLVSELRKKYAYASVLAVQDDSRAWRINRAGKRINNVGLGGGSGYVVRVFDQIGCAEYSFNEFSEEKIPEIVKTIDERIAHQTANVPVGIKPLPTPIPSDETATLKKVSGYAIDPRELGDEKILERLDSIRNKTLSVDGVLDAMVNVSYRKFRKLFISENRDLDQTVMWTNGAIVALALRGEEVKDAYKGFSQLGGAEILDRMEEFATEVANKAIELLSSEQMIPGEYDCICDPDTTGMIVHEAFGHGVEMDMFVKDRALAASFIDERVASDLVTMHDGNAVDDSATMWFDDEGTLTSDTVVINGGILKKGMCDALSAARLGVKPTGNGRRESYERKVYTRMTNTYFEGAAQNVTLDEMIASIKYGFLLESPSSGMEDPKNWGIQCMVTTAREIKDGKLTGKIFSPIVLTGYVPDLLKSVSMMSGQLVTCGGGYCGKGYKEWVKVSDGGPYMKARIRLG